ncbi:MAG: hypothetical protein HQL80_11655 [Magnetococcales bacterium]|nr:hypothetical protein [Magnetococcales bacterium]MBF0584872.1 hypothetical protein [Magnetococcales bacterium]
MNESIDDEIEGAIREIASCLTMLVACPLREVSRAQKDDVLKKAKGMLAKIDARLVQWAAYPRTGRERQEKFKRDEAMLLDNMMEMFEAYRRDRDGSAE